MRKWITALWDGVSNAIFNRFAGNRIFWQRALGRYRKALIKEYRKRKSIFQQEDQLLNLQQVYVSLQVKGKSDDQTLFDADQAIAEFLRLMVLGVPGAGKSMLMWHIAMCYVEGNPIPLPEKPVPVLLNLHDLNDATLSVKQHVVKALAIGSPPAFPKADRFVEQALKHKGLLLLLDGLDEVNGANRASVVQRVKDFLHEHECRAIITCRTAVYHGEFANEVDRTLEVREFSDQQIRSFLEGWKDYIPAEKSIEELIQTLRDRPQILALARNPLLLSIIAYLYTSPRFVLPHSRAEFYQEATDILLRKLDQARLQNSFTALSKRMVLRHLALYYQTNMNRQQQDRLSVDYETILAQMQQELPRLNLATDQAKPLLDEIVERSGLLLAIDNGERYQFAHLTLQEFFAAEELRERETDLIAFFSANQDDWRETVKLWCGLAGDSTRMIENILAIAPLTAFECLADAQRVEQSLAARIVDQFKTQLAALDEKDSITQAFGTVAADTRDHSRGRAVFQFLRETLATSQEPDRWRAAANALSLTNLREATQILATYYSSKSEVQPLLVRMGDLAVNDLATLAESGMVMAFGDLVSIGTPDAALALAGFLWHTNSLIAKQSAWSLAALLAQPGVEDALRKYPMTEAQCRANYLDWIWDPFDEPLDSSLPMITGLIAYLVEHTAIPSIPNPLPLLDNRIVIPLCFVQLIEQLQFPAQYNVKEAEVLLTQAATTPGLNHLLTDFINQSWSINNNKSDALLWSLLPSIPPQLRLDLLNRVVKHLRLPTTNDWRNLFRPVIYEFQTSWHYRAVLGIAALASAIALVQIVYLPMREPQNWVNWLALFNSVIIIDFWLLLCKGIEHPLEPDLLLNFGLLGLKTFLIELRSSFAIPLVASGVRAVLRVLQDNNAVVGGVSVAVASTVAVAVAAAKAVAAFHAVFGIVFGAVFGIGAVAVFGIGAAFIAGGVAGAFAGTGTDTIAVAVTVVGAAVFVFGAVAVATVAAVTATFAVAVAGLVFWSRAEFVNDARRFLAVFAAPFFCWFPITGWFATVALLNFLPWQSVAVIWLMLFGVCTGLWQWGQRLDRQARNPFKGIFDVRVGSN